MHPGLDLGWSCRAAAWLLPSAIGIPMAMRSVLSVHCMYVRTIGRPRTHIHVGPRSHARSACLGTCVVSILQLACSVARQLVARSIDAQYRQPSKHATSNAWSNEPPTATTSESAHATSPARTAQLCTQHRSRNNHVPQLPRAPDATAPQLPTAPHSSPDATAMTTTPRTSPTRQQRIMPTQRNLHLP